MVQTVARFQHLTEECDKAIANPFPGVYDIDKEDAAILRQSTAELGGLKY